MKKILLLSLFSLSIALNGCAKSEPSDLEIRTDTMKNWRDAMSIMGEMIKEPEKFNAAQFQEEARFLATDAHTPWQHFEDNTILGKTTPNVWSDASGFQAEIDKYQQATTQLNNAAANASSAADVSAAFGVVNDTCKSCHSEYKIKDR